MILCIFIALTIWDAQLIFAHGAEVTCYSDVDDTLLKVSYNGKRLEGGMGMIGGIVFQTDADGCGELKFDVTDQDTGSDMSHCSSAGFILFCRASDTKSPWHFFKSDIASASWKAEGNAALCRNTANKPFGNPHAEAYRNFILTTGAQKIWAPQKSVTLIARPCEKFPFEGDWKIKPGFIVNHFDKPPVCERLGYEYEYNGLSGKLEECQAHCAAKQGCNAFFQELYTVYGSYKITCGLFNCPFSSRPIEEVIMPQYVTGMKVISDGDYDKWNGDWNVQTGWKVLHDNYWVHSALGGPRYLDDLPRSTTLEKCKALCLAEYGCNLFEVDYLYQICTLNHCKVPWKGFEPGQCTIQKDIYAGYHL